MTEPAAAPLAEAPKRGRRRVLGVLLGTLLVLVALGAIVAILNPAYVNVVADLAPHASSTYPFRLQRETSCRVILQVFDGDVEMWITADPAPPVPPSVIHRLSGGEGKSIVETLPAGAHLVQIRNASGSRRAQYECKVIGLGAPEK